MSLIFILLYELPDYELLDYELPDYELPDYELQQESRNFPNHNLTYPLPATASNCQ